MHRKILSWGWYDDANTFRLFVHLILKANHAAKDWRGQTVERGQLITGLHSLSKDLKLSVQQIRTSLTKLKSTNEITVKATNKFSLITVINYSSYQDKPAKVTSKITSIVTNEQQTNNKQVTTNNNVNNINNINNKRIDQKEFDQCFEDFWQAGMKKVSKKETKPLFEKYLTAKQKPEGPTIYDLTSKLIADVKARIKVEQLGFAEMHPTTYFRKERFDDEIQKSKPNQIGQQSQQSQRRAFPA